MLAVPHLLRWWSQHHERVQKHVDTLKRDATLSLCESWATGTMAPLDAYGPMVLIQCPLGIMQGVEENATAHAAARHCSAGSKAAGKGDWDGAP